MRPALRIAFCGFWKSFDPRLNFIYRYLSELYELSFSDRPEVLFFSAFGKQHRRYRCRKVFYTGENARPDWNACDYALTFDHLDHPDHYRLPNYAHSGYGDLAALIKSDPDPARLLAGKTGFCNFVYSNPRCEFRNEFFDRLSQYKRVDSGGKVRNNLGYRIGGNSRGKLDFISRYKFTIAFENVSHPGYTTEKLAQPMWAGSLPIYWGNPLVHLDFNSRSFLNYFDYSSPEALIERVIEVDRDDELYAQYVREPWLRENRVPPQFEKASVQAFLQRAIETPRPLVATRPRPSVFAMCSRWWPWKQAG